MLFQPDRLVIYRKGARYYKLEWMFTVKIAESMSDGRIKYVSCKLVYGCSEISFLLVALLIDLFVGLKRTATGRKEIQGDMNNVPGARGTSLK